MGNPSETSNFQQHGLVIGDVQSGKTSTYISIAYKAADAGYKLIILLTGSIENLTNKLNQEWIMDLLVSII